MATEPTLTFTLSKRVKQIAKKLTRMKLYKLSYHLLVNNLRIVKP